VRHVARDERGDAGAVVVALEEPRSVELGADGG
jgi:hypothetical protein